MVNKSHNIIIDVSFFPLDPSNVQAKLSEFKISAFSLATNHKFSGHREVLL